MGEQAGNVYIRDDYPPKSNLLLSLVWYLRLVQSTELLHPY